MITLYKANESQYSIEYERVFDVSKLDGSEAVISADELAQLLGKKLEALHAREMFIKKAEALEVIMNMIDAAKKKKKSSIRVSDYILTSLCLNDYQHLFVKVVGLNFYFEHGEKLKNVEEKETTKWAFDAMVWAAEYACYTVHNMTVKFKYTNKNRLYTMQLIKHMVTFGDLKAVFEDNKHNGECYNDGRIVDFVLFEQMYNEPEKFFPIK